MAYRSRARVARVLAHQEPDRVPFVPFWSLTEDPRYLELLDTLRLTPDQRECYLEGDFNWLGFHERDGSANREVFRPYLKDLPAEASVSDWGVGVLRVRSVDGDEAGARTFHPLAGVNSLRELERYPFPDLSESWRHADLESRVQAQKAAGYTVIGQMSQTILENSYRMRGINALLMDFYDQPEYVEYLFDRMAAQRRIQARRFAEAGVDVLRIGDDIAAQKRLIVSRALYRKFIKPRHAAAIAAARAVNPQIPVLYHSDGNLTELLPDLIEIGVTAINPVQAECMNLREIKREFGRDLTLWGCCSVQSVYEHGARAEVLSELKFLMEHVAPGGGLILQFTNILVNTHTLPNIKTFCEAFWKLGRYG